MAKGYDNAAWFYDTLSQIILGKAPLAAQAYFLNEIPAASRVLIAGGGTGKILEKLYHSTSPLDITFVELSPKMLKRARKRRFGNLQLDFRQMRVQDLKADAFDVIITPFLLDSIPANQFQGVFTHLAGLLKPGGLWLNSDFQLTGKWWQRPLLKTMYVFFRLMGCVKTTSLPPILMAFASKRYHLLDQKSFYGEFISTQLWWKEG